MSIKPKHYRRKGQVTAIQYEGTVESAIACGLKEEHLSHRRYVDTANGMQWVTKGDWVTTEEIGLRGVYGSSQFHLKFEAVEE